MSSWLRASGPTAPSRKAWGINAADQRPIPARRPVGAVFHDTAVWLKSGLDCRLGWGHGQRSRSGALEKTDIGTKFRGCEGLGPRQTCSQEAVRRHGKGSQIFRSIVRI